MLARRVLTSLALELGGEGCGGDLRELWLVLHLNVLMRSR